MTMTVQVAQLRITREMHDAEHALDEALIRGSQLFTSIVTARRDLGLAAAEGQDVLMRLSKSQQSLLSAGGDLARAHKGVLDIHHTITGDMASDCPEGGKAKKPGVLGFNESQAA